MRNKANDFNRMPVSETHSKTETHSKIKITIEPLKTNYPVDSTAKKELDPATRRLLERMRNGKPLGVPENPEQLSHSRLMSERLEEKFHC